MTGWKHPELFEQRVIRVRQDRFGPFYDPGLTQCGSIIQGYACNIAAHLITTLCTLFLFYKEADRYQQEKSGRQKLMFTIQ